MTYAICVVSSCSRDESILAFDNGHTLWTPNVPDSPHTKNAIHFYLSNSNPLLMVQILLFRLYFHSEDDWSKNERKTEQNESIQTQWVGGGREVHEKIKRNKFIVPSSMLRYEKRLMHCVPLVCLVTKYVCECKIRRRKH